MKRWKTPIKLLPVAFLLFVLTGCLGEQNVTALDPQGPQAQMLLDGMVLSLYVMAFVTIVVFAIFFIIVAKFRRKNGDDEIPKQVHGNVGLEVTWTVIPIILLAILAVPTITGQFSLANVEPDPEIGDDTVQVTVTGHQFWWQFDYEDGFTAGQEVYIPAGEKVLFELHSVDVIHSFWVPALGGKVDVVPGITNEMWLEADEPGVYHGKCAELCGASHALMDFRLVALERDDYDNWVAGMQAEETEPEEVLAQEGRELFGNDGYSCIACHAVSGQGTAAGPALTNFGDREILAGYLDPSSDEELAQWIRDPDSLKQHNNMNANPDITDEEMEALIAYLRSLTVLE